MQNNIQPDLQRAIDNAIEPLPDQPIVFTPMAGYEEGHYITHMDQLKHWPLACDEYGMATKWFTKMGHGMPLLIQTVPDLPKAVAGIVNEGGISCTGPDIPEYQAAIDYVMTWVEVETQKIVEAVQHG